MLTVQNTSRETAVRVLLVEDHKPLVRALKQGLEEEGFAVDVAYDGEEGILQRPGDGVRCHHSRPDAPENRRLVAAATLARATALPRTF